MSTLEVIGRVIIGGFFLIAGARHFLHFKQRITVVKTSYGWLLPAPIMAAGFAAQAAAGLALIGGYWIVPAVAVLIAFLVVATPLYHNMFMYSGPERDRHFYMILINFSLAAALLLIAADAVRA
ncbi:MULTISPECIES: DoxX family membrane protein [unclassified Mesorhizobium]|uniref:DoxX family membrane protein n=1 Tax=unclassified Mesorhizobium TaxID=325217 RepID=UPI0015E2BEB8|nr:MULTISPECIES: DoxX family membrane protein [unclassified Mesorhizobium]